jgi:phosphate butyryltransferase
LEAGVKMRYKSFEEVIGLGESCSPVKVSVAAAHDEDVLIAIKGAVEKGLIIPILVGDEKEIRRIANEISFSIDSFTIIPTNTDEEAAYEAAKQAHIGEAKVIMKGLLNSTPFLKGVLHKDFSLKTGRIFSHLSIFEIPGVEKLLYITDGGLNIAPDENQRAQIVVNSVEFLSSIGVRDPKVALLAANELINEKMPVTVECQNIMKLVKSQIPDCQIEGPLPLDLAISKESLKHKGINSEVNGEADLLVVPTIEAGNIFSKGITYFAKGTMAGIVLGATVPLVLNSRSDSPKAKLSSIALAALAASRKDHE